MLALVCTALAAVYVVPARLSFTGDEPRYASEGIALYGHGSLAVTPAEWSRFIERSGLLARKYPYEQVVSAPAQSAVPGIVFGPFLCFGNLTWARWFAFVVCCVGLAGVTRLLRRMTPEPGGVGVLAATLATIALTLPVLAYAQLLYPEVILFALVAWTVVAIHEDRPYLALTLASLLPIVHVRTFALATAAFAIVCEQTARGPRARERLLKIVALAVVLVAAAVVVQLRLYGTLTGPAFALTRPALAHAPERLGMQLFDVRQGLLTYAPAYLFAGAGLVLGSIRRERVVVQSSVLLAAYAATFVWATAAESWPARYWVAGVPLLAVGLAVWLRARLRPLDFAALAPVYALAASDFVLFAVQPLWYLESRRASVVYAALYAAVHVHFGLLLPIDVGVRFPAYAAPLSLLGTYACGLIALLVFSRAARDPRVSAACGTAAVCAVLVPFFWCASRSLPPETYDVATDQQRGTIVIALRSAENVRAVQLDAALPLYWGRPEYPRAIRVRCTDAAGRESESREPSRALVLTPHCDRTTSIRLSADPPGPAPGFARARAGVTILQPAFAVP